MSYFVVRKMPENAVKWEVLLTIKILYVILNIVYT